MTASVNTLEQSASAESNGSVAQKASGSSFYTAMRLLPKAQRDAMFAIYAFCRAVDDIADDQKGDRVSRQRELDRWRTDVDLIFKGEAPPRVAFLVEAVRRFNLNKEDFFAVIDGMGMDTAQDVRGPSLAMLDLYCDRVASAVGRLSVKVFGMDEAPGLKLAHHLGRALQLTNILRDIDEDASIGRLYLPHELLNEAGITSRDPAIAIADSRIDTVCRGVAQLAHRHFDEAEKIFASRPKGRMSAPRLMGAVYSRLLEMMEMQGWAPPRARARIGKGRLLYVALRYGLFG